MVMWASSGTLLIQRPKQPQDATSLDNAGQYPTVATFSPGVPDFGYSTREGYPILMPPTRKWPQTHGLFDQQPTHAPSPVHVLSYRRRRPSIDMFWHAIKIVIIAVGNGTETFIFCQGDAF